MTEPMRSSGGTRAFLTVKEASLSLGITTSEVLARASRGELELVVLPGVDRRIAAESVPPVKLENGHRRNVGVAEGAERKLRSDAPKARNPISDRIASTRDRIAAEVLQANGLGTTPQNAINENEAPDDGSGASTMSTGANRGHRTTT